MITQNIDGLHQAAGSKNVYELHGSVHRNFCRKCRRFYDLKFVLRSQGVPRCPACGGIIKPDVVLYEEPLDQQTMEAALLAIARADLLLIGGTSLAVYPGGGPDPLLPGAASGAHQQKPHALRQERRSGDRGTHRGHPGGDPGLVKRREKRRWPGPSPFSSVKIY